VIRPARCLLQGTRGRRQSLHPGPRNVDARWALASGVVPATAAPELIWELDRRQALQSILFGCRTQHLQSSSGSMNVITGAPSSPGPETAFSVTSRVPSGPLPAVASIVSFDDSAGPATMQ
jgi:hypothetical protein